MIEDGVQIFNFLLKSPRETRRVLAVVGEAIGCEIEVENFSESPAAVGEIDLKHTGFQQHFFITCHPRDDWGDEIENRVASSVAREVGEFVLLDNEKDAYNWFLFSPDGTRALVQIVDTEDSVDVFVPGKSEDGLAG